MANVQFRDVIKRYAAEGEAVGVEDGEVDGLPVVQAIVAGANVTVDDTDPARPVISATSGGGGGAVDSVNGQTGAVVLNHEDVGAASAAQGEKADTAVQPGDDAAVLGSGAAPDGYVLTADGAGGAAWEEASNGGGDSSTVTVEDVTGTSDTIAVGDLGKILRYTAAGLVTVTLPGGIAVGSQVNLLFWGAAGGVIQGDGTSTVQPEGSVAQYGEVSCVVVATDTWSVQGQIS